MKKMIFNLLLFFTCGIVSSLDNMVTDKPPRQTKYTSNVTNTTNGTKFLNVATTTATGVILYKVTDSNGATCILLKVDGVIEVYFKSHIGTEQAATYMLADAAIEGDCRYEATASMMIKWDGHTMVWNFAKTPGGERWYVSTIELAVSAELERYNSIRRNILPEKNFKLVHTEMLFPTPVGKSYACEETTVTLTFPEDQYNPASLNGRLVLRTFQLQPFMYKSVSFGPAFNCNAILAFRNVTAPIAIGSTLALAVLGIVTGYGLFRYFKVKKGHCNTRE